MTRFATEATAAVWTINTPIADRMADVVFDLFGLGYDLVGKTSIYRRNRKAIAELDALTPQQLDDIGLTRDQIPAAVKGDFIPYR